MDTFRVFYLPNVLSQWLSGKEHTCNAGTGVQSLDQEDPLRRKWQPTPVLWAGKSHGQATVHGVSKCWTWLSTKQQSTLQTTLHLLLRLHQQSQVASNSTLDLLWSSSFRETRVIILTRNCHHPPKVNLSGNCVSPRLVLRPGWHPYLLLSCLVTQLCPSLCDPLNCSPAGFLSMGFPSKNTGVGGATFSPRGSPQPRDGTHICVSCPAGGLFTTEPPGKPCPYLSHG